MSADSDMKNNLGVAVSLSQEVLDQMGDLPEARISGKVEATCNSTTVSAYRHGAGENQSVETRTPVGDGVYLHINNGGITFGVEQRTWKFRDSLITGPVLAIRASHFSCRTNSMDLVTNKGSLRLLGNYLLQCADDPDLVETEGCADGGAMPWHHRYKSEGEKSEGEKSSGEKSSD